VNATISPLCQTDLRGFHFKVILKEGGDLQVFFPDRYRVFMNDSFFVDVRDPSRSGVFPWSFYCRQLRHEFFFLWLGCR
jgi:hypothetical protein